MRNFKENSISTLCEAMSSSNLPITDAAATILGSLKIQSSILSVANSPRLINRVIVQGKVEVMTPLALYSSYVGM